jgi:hypothetical protein
MIYQQSVYCDFVLHFVGVASRPTTLLALIRALYREVCVDTRRFSGRKGTLLFTTKIILLFVM